MATQKPKIKIITVSLPDSLLDHIDRASASKFFSGNRSATVRKVLYDHFAQFPAYVDPTPIQMPLQKVEDAC